MPPFQLGPLFFSTKKAAIAYVADFLKTHPKKQHLAERDLAWVYPLFQRHPRAMSKLKDVTYVFVDKIASEDCFILEYENGSYDEMSHIECFKPSENDKIICIHAAFRKAIADDMYAFKEETLSTQTNCALCSAPLTPGIETSTDHSISKRPFCGLVYDFLTLKGLEMKDVKLKTVPFGMNGTQQVLQNETLEKEWVAYHKEHATLQLVCRICTVVASHGAKRVKRG